MQYINPLSAISTPLRPPPLDICDIGVKIIALEKFIQMQNQLEYGSTTQCKIGKLEGFQRSPIHS